jgi:hypothetical protein
VFAIKALRPGQRVFLFSRRVRRIDHPPGCHCSMCCRCIQVSRYGWLYPAKGSAGWYLNHSCVPTCGIRGRHIVALRGLGEGEEITIDYATTNADSKWRMRCRCGSNGCRRIIRSVQHLSPALFRKYARIMPPYVRKQRKK